MKRYIFALFGTWAAVSGCVIDNSGQTLQLTGAVAANPPACVFDPAATIFRSSGTRDIATSSLGNYGYVLGPRLVNNAKSVATYGEAWGPQGNVYVEANDVTLDGYNVCYEFMGFRNTTEAPNPAEPLEIVTGPTCKAKQLPMYFISAVQTITVAGGLAIASVDLFPPSVTQAVPMPEDLDMTVTAAQIAAERTLSGRTDTTLYPDAYIAQSVITGRNIAAQGGNPFLAGLERYGAQKRVLVHLQAVGRTSDQRRIESNEFIYPIDLCNSCLERLCTVDATSLCIGGQDTGGTCSQ
jgi:hypothetical protein